VIKNRRLSTLVPCGTLYASCEGLKKQGKRRMRVPQATHHRSCWRTRLADQLICPGLAAFRFCSEKFDFWVVTAFHPISGAAHRGHARRICQSPARGGLPQESASRMAPIAIASRHTMPFASEGDDALCGPGRRRARVSAWLRCVCQAAVCGRV